MDTSLDILKLLWNRISRPMRIAFMTALSSGIVAHLFMFTNKLTNWDDLMETPDVGAGGFIGRWLLLEVNQWLSTWSSPSVNGIMMIVFLAIAAAFVAEALHIRSVTGAFLTGLLMVTFPGVASTLTFMYTAAAYGLAILMVVIGVFMTERYRFGWIIGALLLFLSLTIYQAYFSFGVALLLLIVILDLLEGKDVKTCLVRAGKFIGTLAAGMVAYLISIKVNGYELVSYKGLDNIGQGSAKTYIIAILRAYHRLLQYFITGPESYMVGRPTKLSRLCIVVTLLLLVAVILQKKVWRDKVRLIWTFVGLALLPLATALVYVMASEVDHASTVMIYAYLTVYLLPIALVEKLKADRMTSRALALAAGCILLLVGYSNFKIDNAAYYRTYIADRRVTSYATRILTKLEAQEGFHYGDTVMILGDSWPEPLAISAPWYMDGQEFYDLEGLALEDGLFMPSNRIHYIEVFLGVDLGRADETARDAIKETAQYQQMPVWPEDGCIERIGDAWIVKVE